MAQTAPAEPAVASLAAEPEQPANQVCATCGFVSAPGAAFCSACGTGVGGGEANWPPPVDKSSPSAPKAEQTAVTINLPPALTRLHRYLAPDTTQVLPVPLWGAVGLLVVAGLFVVVPSLQALPDALGLLDQGEFGQRLGLLLTVLLLLVISFGSACFYLAVKLIRADRAGRILTIVLASSLGFGLLLGDNLGGTATLAIIGCGGVVAILTLVEEVRRFFTGPEAAQAGIAASVVAANSIVVALSYVLGVTGVLFLLLGDLAERFVIVGLLMVIVAIAAFKFAKQLLSGDENARLVVTGLMAADIVGLFILDPEGAGLFVPIALAGSVIGLLWVPDDARRHFV